MGRGRGARGREFGGGGRGWRNMFFATGLPGWMRFDRNAAAQGGASPDITPDPEAETQALRARAAALQSELDRIATRMGEI